MDSRHSTRNDRRETRLIAVFLGLLATAVLAISARTEGYTRDEGYYFDAAEFHDAYYEEAASSLLHGKLTAFSKSTIDRFFSYNHEHPPLMKTLFGLSWRLLHKCNCPAQAGRHPFPYPRAHVTLELLSESAALRLPAHLFGGLLVALVFLFGTHAWSRRVGFIAALLALFSPRYFFDAQLACFDAPVATTWILTIYCYERSLSERRYALPAGIALGLALATKHNSFFIPILLVAHYLWIERASILAGRLPRIPAAFVYMALVAPLVYLALWPWLWWNTVARFREYVGFHLNHVFYNFEYLGTNYNKPPSPRSFTTVMTLLTTPVTTLLLAALGTLSLIVAPWMARRQDTLEVSAKQQGGPPPPPVFVWRPAVVGRVVRTRGEATAAAPPAPRSTAPGLLVVMNALFPLAIITLTGAPIFGGTKHWHPAVPFIALLAGVGADMLCTLSLRSFPSPRWTPARALAVAATLSVLPAALETARSHPYGLSYYNMLAGGPPGGADLGMNRQFWGYATRGILPFINTHTPRNAQIYWHDTNQAQLNMNVREGLMRGDIGNTGLEEPGVKASTTAMVIHEKHFNKYEYWIWDFYGTARPSYVLTDEGVPLVTVYERPPNRP